MRKAMKMKFYSNLLALALLGAIGLAMSQQLVFADEAQTGDNSWYDQAFPTQDGSSIRKSPRNATEGDLLGAQAIATGASGTLLTFEEVARRSENHELASKHLRKLKRHQAAVTLENYLTDLKEQDPSHAARLVGIDYNHLASDARDATEQYIRAGYGEHFTPDQMQAEVLQFRDQVLRAVTVTKEELAERLVYDELFEGDEQDTARGFRTIMEQSRAIEADRAEIARLEAVTNRVVAQDYQLNSRKEAIKSREVEIAAIKDAMSDPDWNTVESQWLQAKKLAAGEYDSATARTLFPHAIKEGEDLGSVRLRISRDAIDVIRNNKFIQQYASRVVEQTPPARIRTSRLTKTLRVLTPILAADTALGVLHAYNGREFGAANLPQGIFNLIHPETDPRLKAPAPGVDVTPTGSAAGFIPTDTKSKKGARGE